VRLALAAHPDHDEVLGCGGAAIEMAADGKAGTVALGGRRGGRQRPLANLGGETRCKQARRGRESEADTMVLAT
jgi:LmbE family N-acetylglucosaminyl deacetylase